MKSPSTLIALHEKAINVLELLDECNTQIAKMFTNLMVFHQPYEQRPLWAQFRSAENKLRKKRDGRLLARVRILNYYDNILKQIR